MEKSELLHKIFNKLVLPMNVLEMVIQMGDKSQDAKDQMMHMIEELKNEVKNEATDE